MGVRYIGSKSRVAAEIVSLAGPPDSGRFVDAFTGTGSVAAEAARRGWSVHVNDTLSCAVVMACSAVIAADNVEFKAFGGYASACEALDALPGVPGFITREYSPASASHGGERRYFTEENAARIDTMRAEIARWSRAGLLSDLEEKLLVADLMLAANHVANIAGTYGCFLSSWLPQALRPLTIRARQLRPGFTDVTAESTDVAQLRTGPADTVYFDPPYTKRQYAAYYHLLETIAAGDQPEVSGVTGLRPWTALASPFCYKRRALRALVDLISATQARRILLSYSSEGHVPQDQLLEGLNAVGATTLHLVREIGRYRPNAVAAAASSTVTEYVIEIVPDTSASKLRVSGAVSAQ